MLTYMAQHSKQDALDFIGALEEKTRTTLTTLPESGTLHRGGTRYLVVLDQVVVYEYDKANDIVSILHYFGKGENWK